MSAHAEDEAPAVYSALFREFGEGPRQYVIRETPEALEDRGLSGALADRMREFHFPAKPLRHRRSEFPSGRTRLMSDREYIEIFSDSRSCAAAWKAFHARYPESKVLLAFSQVGLKEEAREAAVLIYTGSGCLGGSWDILFFARDESDRAWKFKEAENVGRA
jgi:hypothetical protein